MDLSVVAFKVPWKKYTGIIYMKDVYYKQCHLTKKTKETTWEQTSFIPEEFAVVGKVIKIKENGVWDDGWIVKEAGSRRVHEDLLPDSHTQVKRHRQATGDSLPKNKN